jgi:succinyl-diaminopimelate desuccinylase
MTEGGVKERIEALVEQNRDAIVESLRALLRFKTVGGGADPAAAKAFQEETARCLAFVGEEAKKLGFAWRNRDNLYAVASLVPEKPFIALPVHTDVVPPGDGWSHGPFDGDLADGVIYGRGAQDDKGPLVACLYAMKVLQQLEMPVRRGVRLVVGTAEEWGDWPDMFKYRDSEPAADYAIVSDANFPIINGEKGMLNLKVTGELPADAEPAVGGFRLKSALAGERANIVPPKAVLTFAGDPESNAAHLERELSKYLEFNTEARARLEKPQGTHDVEIRFEGRSAHGSTPQEGHSALLDMLQFMTQSGFVTDDEADLAEFLFDAGYDMTGEFLGINVTHDFIGPTTVNLGVLNWKDSGVEAVFNIRPTLGLAIADAVSRVRARVAEFGDETGFDFECEPFSKSMEAIWVNPEEYPEFIVGLQEAYTEMTGREATLSAIGGTTYAKVFANAVCFGPVDPAEESELAHQVDERVSVEHLLRNVRIYACALAKLCA